MIDLLLSDIHAYPDLIFNAIEAEERRTGTKVESIIGLGDYIDIGPDPIAVLDFFERDPRVRKVLVGNHETSIMLKNKIMPQSAESFHLRGRLIRNCGDDGWDVVYHVDDILLSHAGLSTLYGPLFKSTAVQQDREKFCKILNGWAKDELHKCLHPTDGHAFKWHTMFMDDEGPLWYRPGSATLLPDVIQVAGHTPDEYYDPVGVKYLQEMGLYLIDPYSRETGLTYGRYKYAIIENGEVQVFAGVLE